MGEPIKFCRLKNNSKFTWRIYNDMKGGDISLKPGQEFVFSEEGWAIFVQRFGIEEIVKSGVQSCNPKGVSLEEGLMDSETGREL